MRKPAFIGHVAALVLIGFSLYHYFRMDAGLGRSYPRKPVRVVVPFDPGGGSDTFVRILQKAINDSNLMPQPLVVVNKPGGGTTIGSSYVKDARSDGYTVLCLHEALLVAKSTGQSPNGPDDYEAVAATGQYEIVVVVSEQSRFQSLAKLMDTAVSEPKTVKFGVNFNTPAHFVAIMLEKAAPGSQFRFVSTGGGAHRLGALMGGHIDATIFSVGEYMRFEENGLKAIAYLGESRADAIADVPTGAEQGYPVFGGNLHYWWFPKGTDQHIVNYFAGVLEKALKTEYVIQRTRDLHIDPKIIAGEALQDRIDDRMEAFGAIKPEQRTKLPDIPFWTLASILGLGAIVGWKHFRETRSEMGMDSEPFKLRFDLAFWVVGFAVAYVLLMGLGLLSFVWATLLFIIVSGLSLMGASKRYLPTIVEVGLVMSFGIHYVFTQIFAIDLP